MELNNRPAVALVQYRMRIDERFMDRGRYNQCSSWERRELPCAEFLAITHVWDSSGVRFMGLYSPNPKESLSFVQVLAQIAAALCTLMRGCQGFSRIADRAQHGSICRENALTASHRE